MATAKFSKIRIALHTLNRYPLLDFLQEQGYFEFEDVSGNLAPEIISYFEEESTELDHKLAQIEFAYKLILKHAPKQKSDFSGLLLGGKEVVSEKEMKKIANNFYWQDVVEKCRDASEKISKSKAHIKALESEKELLEGWKRLDFSLSEEKETARTKEVFLSFAEADWLKFRDESRENKHVATKTVGHHKEKVAVIVVFLKEEEKAVKDLIVKCKGEEVSLPARRGTVTEELDRIKRAEKSDEKAITEAEKLLSSLGEHTPKLKVMYDFFLQRRERQLVRRKFYHSEKIGIVQGWIKEEAMPELKAKLEEIADKNYLVEKVKLEKGETPPVELENEGPFGPFEAVTSIYGLPKANEPDPTPFLSVFFIVFFGLCLTDAMYGLTLSLLSFGALYVFKIPRASRKLFTLLGWGGVVTFLAGVLFGGYFGITPEQAPEFLTVGEGSDKKFLLQMINPAAGNGPLNFLILSFIFGITHVMFGIAIDGWWKVKQGDKVDAILGPFLWLFVIIMGLLAVMNNLDLLAVGSMPLNLMLVGVVLLVLTQGRDALKNFKKKSIGGKIGSVLAAFFKGLLSLYSVVGYFSDVLSYSRIMALGLGTGIIAYAVNIIAGIAAGMIPYVGFLFAALILIMGHLANLGLSALGAFIHSGRLQYVEFFGHFLEGGGRAFKPFKKPSKYTIFKKQF